MEEVVKKSYRFGPVSHLFMLVFRIAFYLLHNFKPFILIIDSYDIHQNAAKTKQNDHKMIKVQIDVIIPAIPQIFLAIGYADRVAVVDDMLVCHQVIVDGDAKSAEREYQYRLVAPLPLRVDRLLQDLVFHLDPIFLLVNLFHELLRGHLAFTFAFLLFLRLLHFHDD